MGADKVSATLEVQFGIEGEAGGEKSIALALDEDMNLEPAAEPGGEPTIKSEFAFGEKAYIKVTRPNTDPYTMLTTWGTLKLEKEEVESKTPITEDIVFTQTFEGSLSAVPSTIQGWEWVGTDPGFEPSFTEAVATLEKPTIGVLRVKYLVRFDRWSLKVDNGTGGLGIGDEDAMPSLVIAIQGSQKANLTVNFSDGSADETHGSLSLALDEDMNVEPPDPEDPEAEPTVKSEFVFGEKAYIRVFKATREDYTMRSTWGRLRPEGSGVRSKMPIEQDVQFGNAPSASLSSTPSGIQGWEWIGRDPGVSPRFSGAEITVPEKITAILKVYYFVKFDRWSLVVDERIGDLGDPDIGPVPALVVAVQGDQSASLTVNFTDEKSLGPEEYDVVVVWDCSENSPVPGATVRIGGQTFVTGTDGSCGVGLLTPKATYQVSADKDGKSATYQVTIPEPKEDEE